jgi:pyruvate formate lyase activating enzyme
MNNGLVGKVFDIQGFTVNDGPGIRTEIFLKGCPLRCLWCHSPESQAPYSQVAWYEIRCIGVENCGKCLEICPKGALKKGKKIYSKTQKANIQIIDLNREACDNCGKCTEICPADALAIAGTDMTIDEIMKRIDKDRPFYRKSGGGVTISGGEPMLQYRFTKALLQECKSKGLHTCLDTSGYAKWEYYKDIIKYVDLVLYDIKHMDTEQSRVLTGVPNELILKNARKMAAEGTALQIRIPIVPGYNDSEENLRATSEFCLELGPAVKLVQILPYHRLGAVKYKRLQRKYKLESVEPPSSEHMDYCKRLIESYGLHVQIH